jgi:flagellar basal body-associated protein FliL
MFGWLNKIYNFVFQSALFMENKNYQEDLQHIRKMMEKSSRFISLSGISGVFAGLFALAGAIYVYFFFKKNGVDYFEGTVKYYEKDFIVHLVIVAMFIMVLAISSGAYFTIKKSKAHHLQIWDANTKKLLYNFAIPLGIGGLFCVGLLYHGLHGLLSPATLIFYGLALFNAGNYTFSDIKYLGLCEMALGIVSLFFLGYGLFFWAVGFGVLHIVYGLIMHKKYN